MDSLMIIKLCWRIKALFSSSSYYRKEKKLKKKRLNVVKEVMNASKQAPMAWCWNCLQFALQNMGDWIPSMYAYWEPNFGFKFLPSQTQDFIRVSFVNFTPFSCDIIYIYNLHIYSFTLVGYLLDGQSILL